MRTGRALLLTLTLSALPLGLALHAEKPAERLNQAPKSGEVAGTAQTPGDTGQFGRTYTIQGNQSLVNVTLLSAEWTVSHLVASDGDQIRPDLKELVIHFTVQNPTKDLISAKQIFLSGVDSADNAIDASDILDEATHHTDYTDLHPGQKQAAFVYLQVADNITIPKLLLQNGDKVVRFDLHGVPKPLSAPFAAKNPELALSPYPGALAAWYPANGADWRLDSLSLQKTSIGGVDPPEGGQLLVATLSLRGVGPGQTGVGPYNVQGNLRDTDGQEVTPTAVLFAGRDAALDATLGSGQTAGARVIWPVQAGENLNTLTLDPAGARPAVFDVSHL